MSSSSDESSVAELSSSNSSSASSKDRDPRAEQSYCVYDGPPSSPSMPPSLQSSPFRRTPVSSPVLRARSFTSSSASSDDSFAPPIVKRKIYELSKVPPWKMQSSVIADPHESNACSTSDELRKQRDTVELMSCDEEIEHSNVNSEVDIHTASGLMGEEDDISDSANSTIEISDISSADSSSSEEDIPCCDEQEQIHEREDSSDASSSSSTNESSSEEEDRVIHFGSLPVYDGCELTVDEGVILMIELFSNNKLEKKTLDNILRSVLCFMPKQNNLPKTKHTLFKYVEKLSPPLPVQTHYYCKMCHMYIGLEEKNCPLKCKSSIGKFYELPIENQIRNLFENHNLAHLIEKYADERSKHTDGKLRDVCDGQEYKRVKVNLPGKYDLILLGHTDGISISVSSTVSLWPLEFVICELPPNLRFKFVLTAAIWVDSSKPNMHCFMKPGVAELSRLGTNGLTWNNPVSQEQMTSKATSPAFSVDAPVRAQIQNILSHGGKYACHSCEQKTVRLPPEPVLPGVQKKKRARVYMPQANPSVLRSHQRMEAQGKLSRDNQQVTGKLTPKKGVKGRSIVAKIPFCDRSTVVFPEYMHILIGIIKMFMVLWFETDGEWSLKDHRDEINTFLESICVPDFLTRIPRSTDCFNSWKANECRSFLLYFSLITLAKFMTKKYLQHWLLFVQGLYTLLKDEVSEEDIQKAEAMLDIFVTDFVDLYDAKYVTYNLHCLTHFGLMTRRWGPPFCNAAFPWENFNGGLQQRIHGSKNQGIELVKTVQICQGAQILRARINTESHRQNNIGVHFLNKMKKKKLTSEQKDMLMEKQCFPVLGCFHRAEITRQVYTCNKYRRQKKRNNYTICYSDSEYHEYAEVHFFLESSSKKKLAFVQCFEIEHHKMFYHDSGFIVDHLIPINDTKRLKLVDVNQILFKVLRVGDFVCLRPNKHEVNL